MAEETGAIKKKEIKDDKKEREDYADFFTDGITGPIVFVIAILFDYSQPSVFMMTHLLSIVALIPLAHISSLESSSSALAFFGASCVAFLLQVDLNFFIQVVCAIDPEACCGEVVSQASTTRPVCSHSVPQVSIVGGVVLLVAIAVVVCMDVVRWFWFVSDNGRSIVTLPIVVKLWQISYMTEWENKANFATLFIGITSILQTLCAILAFFAAVVNIYFERKESLTETVRLSKWLKEKVEIGFNVCCAFGVVFSYASSITQSLLIKSDQTSDLFGKETVAPIANLFFTCVTLLAFLGCMYFKEKDVAEKTDTFAQWFADIPYKFKYSLPLLPYASFVLFTLALVLLDDSPLFNATMITIIFYLVSLLAQTRLMVYVTDDMYMNFTALASYALADVTFLGLVITRWDDEYRSANWCLIAALILSIIHGVLVGSYIAYVKNKKDASGTSGDSSNDPKKPGAMRNTGYYPISNRTGSRAFKLL